MSTCCEAEGAGASPYRHERLKQAATALPRGAAAQLFVDALTELVQAQADTTGAALPAGAP
ncbi:hypothetical protein AB0942_33950 [Streptomyces nodosus]|uniref:hypothetical protein n=1 Tax=Streptomyces nodosus TaxID=40318 RepID=UPI003456D65E